MAGCRIQLERGCYEILLPKARAILKVNSFKELEIGRHTAKPTHHVSCSLVILTDAEPEDIAMNLITCHVPFIPGKLPGEQNTSRTQERGVSDW